MIEQAKELVHEVIGAVDMDEATRHAVSQLDEIFAATTWFNCDITEHVEKLLDDVYSRRFKFSLK